MGARKLDHIGIAVRSLDEGRALYEALGMTVSGTDVVPEQGVKVAFLELGSTRLELLEPTDPGSPIARHLERRGPGIHHICLEVEDIEVSMRDLTEAGFRLLSDAPQPGAHHSRVCFLHPSAAGGVLVELSQPAAAGK